MIGVIRRKPVNKSFGAKEAQARHQRTPFRCKTNAAIVSRGNSGRFGLVPVRSGRFGPGRFGPISGMSRFGPFGVGGGGGSFRPDFGGDSFQPDLFI